MFDAAPLSVTRERRDATLRCRAAYRAPPATPAAVEWHHLSMGFIYTGWWFDG